MAAVLLFENTNMVDVTSCQNTLYTTIQPNIKAPMRLNSIVWIGSFDSFVMTVPEERPHVFADLFALKTRIQLGS